MVSFFKPLGLDYRVVSTVIPTNVLIEIMMRNLVSLRCLIEGEIAQGNAISLVCIVSCREHQYAILKLLGKPKERCWLSSINTGDMIVRIPAWVLPYCA
jgi:hypothetical protein